MTSKVTVKANKPIHAEKSLPTEPRSEETRRPRVDSPCQSIYILLET
jgi:hypothetical protein